MVFRRREIQLSGDGTCGLCSSSSLANHLTAFHSHTVIEHLSPTTLFRCGTSHASDGPIWQGGMYVLPLQHH